MWQMCSSGQSFRWLVKGKLFFYFIVLLKFFSRCGNLSLKMETTNLSLVILLYSEIIPHSQGTYVKISSLEVNALLYQVQVGAINHFEFKMKSKQQISHRLSSIKKQQI